MTEGLKQSLKPWIETWCGVRFDLLNPTEDMILIEDIAHALSQQCRFTGHTMFHYSVAQHCFLGSLLFDNPLEAFEFLMHDSSESYLGDVSTPLKHATKIGDEYLPVEEKLMLVIRKKYGLPVHQTEAVSRMDALMLNAERKQLMYGLAWDRLPVEGEQAAVTINEITPREAEVRFLSRFVELRRQLENEKTTNAVRSVTSYN